MANECFTRRHRPGNELPDDGTLLAQVLEQPAAGRAPPEVTPDPPILPRAEDLIDIAADQVLGERTPAHLAHRLRLPRR